MIKEAIPNSPLERYEVIRVVIGHTFKELKCDNGMVIPYDDKAAVVIDQERNPKVTWVAFVSQKLVSGKSLSKFFCVYLPLENYYKVSLALEVL